MSLRGLFGLVQKLPRYQNLIRDLHSGRAEIVAGPAEKSLLISSLCQSIHSPLLVVSPRPEAARRIYDQLSIYSKPEHPPLFFPEPESLPYELPSTDHITNTERLQVLGSLTDSQTRTPSIIVTSLAGILYKTLSIESFRKASLSLSPGQTLRLRELIAHLINIGYRREPSVEMPGTFSIRGGIIDVFSPNTNLPVRLDMDGDEIDTLNLFDPSSQRSVENVHLANIIPAQEMLPSLATQEPTTATIVDSNFAKCSSNVRDKIENDLTTLLSEGNLTDASLYNGFINRSSLLDYLPRQTSLILEDEIELGIESDLIQQRFQQICTAQVSEGELPSHFPSPYLNWAELKKYCETYPQITVKAWDGINDNLGFETPPHFYGNLNDFTSTVKRTQQNGGSITVVSRHSKRIAEILGDSDIGSSAITDMNDMPGQGDVNIISGYLEQGWQISTNNIHHYLYTDLEIFGTIKERRNFSRRPARRAPILSQIEFGTYVVHEDHGIARFAGTTSLNATGDDREYLILEYAEKDRIYIPTDQLDRISPYIGASDRPPKLTRLDSFEWSRAKQRVKESTQEMAKGMLDLYAKRQVAKGHSFASDTIWQQEMEGAFPFEETEDQARTIDEVKNDMELVRPMDRLVCGDVGYGKTEVALRAAFKSVNDGLQVAMLVPTTILAQQHYATFSARLSPYPVTVEVLSRFRSQKEQKEIVDGLKKGAVDIVIGTHRLVQKDVKFKNLGLVLVDEEQRFGVNHKESLKRLRKEVDFLTLSATPIPRTLYMALSGIRDMSTMETPPEERFPVKTFVGEYNDEVIKEAILRELERDGQVFFLHNRIRSIQRVSEQLKSLIPEARVSVAHGRMAEEDLENQMLAFNNGEIDVLVCTTIIESGLDIPNANTLIIDRADRFGLAQLYQLRGRIGRGRTRAYCYLLSPKRQQMTDEAEKRLRAILEASEIGSGYRIAMRDLEIRGAGNILGSEQSGYIHAIGFELYTRLLNQAITELHSEQEETASTDSNPQDEVRIDLPLSAYIPKNYVSHLPTRLSVYQRLTSLRTQEQVDDLRNEFRDRFGPLPETVENLFYIVSLKIMSDGAFVRSITTSNGVIILTLKEPIGGASTVIHKTIGDYATVGHQQIRLNRTQIGTNWMSTLENVLQKLKRFQDTLPMLN